MNTPNYQSGGGSAASSPESTSSSLLEKAKGRDPEAWRRLVRIYGPLVYQWGRQCGLQSQDAADVVQEVFGSVASGVSAFQRVRPGDSFRGWLWTITRNKVRDCFRSLKGTVQAQGGTAAQQRLAQVREQPPAGAEPDATQTAPPTPEYRALELVRAAFEEKTWEAFRRTTVDGLTAAEAAAELGLTPEAVYKARSRVLRRIREELGELLEG